MSDLSRAVLAALRDLCATCGGLGEIEESRDAFPTEANGGRSQETRWIPCPACQPTTPKVIDVMIAVDEKDVPF